MKPNPLLLLWSAVTALMAMISGCIAQPNLHLPNYGEQPPVACVTLFANEYFEGESITLAAGESWDDFSHVRFPSGRNANNRVSSVLIEGHAQVTLFDYRDFEGSSITLSESVSRLDHIPQGRRGDWDNEVSSIVVSSGSLDSAGPFGGNAGYHQSPAVHLPTIHRPHVGYHPNDSYDEPVRDLGDDNWEKHIYLDRHTVQLVERAYQDVFGRTLDASGRSTYARVVQDRGWSESRLRKELRRSPEYRDIVVPRTVKTAYLEVLGREADSAGLRFYTSKMTESGWNDSRIRDALKKSPEYANRTRIGAPRGEPTILPPNGPQKSYTAPKPDRPKATYVATKPDRPKTNVVVRKPDRPKVKTTPAKPDRPKATNVATKPERPKTNIVVRKPDHPKVKTTSAKPDRPKATNVATKPDRPKTNVVVRTPDRPKVSASRPNPPPRKEKEQPAKRPPPKLR